MKLHCNLISQKYLCKLVSDRKVFHLETVHQTLRWIIYYFAFDTLKHHLKMTMNRPSVFLSERKPKYQDAKKTHPAKPKPKEHKTEARQSFSTELRDWENLQTQLCLSLVSPRGSTHRLYGSAPTKLYY